MSNPMPDPDISYYRHLGGPWYWTILIAINTGVCPLHPQHLTDGHCPTCRAWWYWDPDTQSVHRAKAKP